MIRSLEFPVAADEEPTSKPCPFSGGTCSDQVCIQKDKCRAEDADWKRAGGQAAHETSGPHVATVEVAADAGELVPASGESKRYTTAMGVCGMQGAGVLAAMELSA
jgi:hypothetical protein